MEDIFDKEMQLDSDFAALRPTVAFKYEFWDILQFRQIHGQKFSDRDQMHVQC